MDRRMFLAGSVALLAERALGKNVVSEKAHAHGARIFSSDTHDFHAHAPNGKMKGVQSTHKASGKKEFQHKKFKSKGRPKAGLDANGISHHIIADHPASGLAGEPAQVVVYIGFAFVYTVTYVFWYSSTEVDATEQDGDDYAGQ